MSEVEKMYRNSGIEKCNRLLKPCPFKNQCDDCEHNWYPEFTARKQLELIKWLAKYDISIWHTKVWDIEADELSGCISGEVFENVLAQYINYIWQDLTEEERKQIKEILK